MNSLLSSLVVLGLVEDFVWAQQYTAVSRYVVLLSLDTVTISAAPLWYGERFPWHSGRHWERRVCSNPEMIELPITRQGGPIAAVDVLEDAAWDVHVAIQCLRIYAPADALHARICRAQQRPGIGAETRTSTCSRDGTRPVWVYLQSLTCRTARGGRVQCWTYGRLGITIVTTLVLILFWHNPSREMVSSSLC